MMPACAATSGSYPGSRHEICQHLRRSARPAPALVERRARLSSWCAVKVVSRVHAPDCAWHGPRSPRRTLGLSRWGHGIVPTDMIVLSSSLECATSIHESQGMLSAQLLRPKLSPCSHDDAPDATIAEKRGLQNRAWLWSCSKMIRRGSRRVTSHNLYVTYDPRQNGVTTVIREHMAHRTDVRGMAPDRGTTPPLANNLGHEV